MRPVRHFVIVADRARDSVTALYDFGTDGTAAVDRFAALEEEYRSHSSVDVACLGADSLETVGLTHSTYFDGYASELRRQGAAMAAT